MATSLSVAQTRIYTDPHRFRMAVCGRRFGKTFLALWEIWRAAIRARHQNVLYIAPNYSDAKKTMWQPLMEFIPEQLIKSSNVSEMSVELINGSYVRLTGAQTDTGIRGGGNDFVIMDECSSISDGLFQSAVFPSLADREGRFLGIGTPVGFNWVYDLFRYADDPLLNHAWSSHQFTTIQGGNVSIEELELHRLTMTPEMFHQEYGASFEALVGRVYGYYDPSIHDRRIEMNPKLPILLGCDFNVNPVTASVGQIHRGKNDHREIQIHDEIYLPNSDTFQLVAEVKNRYPNRKIICYPDASGNARKTSAKNTDHGILRSAGFQVVTDNSNPRIADRINEVQACFKNADGMARLFIDPKCKNLKKSMGGLTYKEGTTLPDKSSGLDHMADGLGYMIHHTFPINYSRGKTTSASL